MHIPTITSLLLLPLLAIAETSSTTTLTSTATLTKTVTVSQVVASVTSTYAAHNSTTAGPTAIGTGSSGNAGAPTQLSTSSTPSSTIPSNFMGAASSLNSMYAGSAGVMVMIAMALL